MKVQVDTTPRNKFLHKTVFNKSAASCSFMESFRAATSAFSKIGLCISHESEQVASQNLYSEGVSEKNVVLSLCGSVKKCHLCVNTRSIPQNICAATENPALV